MSSAFLRNATGRASTKRPPTSSGGGRGGRTAYLSYVKHTPIDAADPRNPLVQSLMLDDPIELHETQTEDVDIQKGHEFISDGVIYIVKAMARYVGPTHARASDAYRYLVLEKSAV